MMIVIIIIIIIVIIIIIIILIMSLMQSIYIYIPKKDHVPMECSDSAFCHYYSWCLYH